MRNLNIRDKKVIQDFFKWDIGQMLGLRNGEIKQCIEDAKGMDYSNFSSSYEHVAASKIVSTLCKNENDDVIVKVISIFLDLYKDKMDKDMQTVSDDYYKVQNIMRGLEKMNEISPNSEKILQILLVKNKEVDDFAMIEIESSSVFGISNAKSYINELKQNGFFDDYIENVCGEISLKLSSKALEYY